MKTFDKHGRVWAVDAAKTGEEPTWEDIDSLTEEQFTHRRNNCLAFYNYYLKAKDLKAQTLAWMKKNGFTKPQITHVKSLPDTIPGTTCGKFCRAMLMGMPGTFGELEHDDTEYCTMEINKALQTPISVTKKPKAESDKPAISPQVLLAEKVNRLVVAELDWMLDDVFIPNTVKVEPLNLYSLLKAQEIPTQGLKYVSAWLEKIHAEYKEAMDGTDPDSVEGFSYLKKAAIKNRVKALEELMAQVEKYRGDKGKTKAVKKVKPKDPLKVVARVKYLEKDGKLQSLAPLATLGARVMYLYTPKYKRLSVVVSDSGISYKGSAIESYDTEKSFVVALRKPDEVLPVIMGGSKGAIDKALKSLTTKRGTYNGRINNQTLIVRKI